MLDRKWLIKVEHIYREGNRPANYLDGLCHILSLGVHDVFVSDPIFFTSSLGISQPV
ncbi:hypothetical protein LINGRAHAP2_LOCUS12630 [Linum grandiflorum]